MRHSELVFKQVIVLWDTSELVFKQVIVLWDTSVLVFKTGLIVLWLSETVWDTELVFKTSHTSIVWAVIFLFTPLCISVFTLSPFPDSNFAWLVSKDSVWPSCIQWSHSSVWCLDFGRSNCVGLRVTYKNACKAASYLYIHNKNCSGHMPRFLIKRLLVLGSWLRYWTLGRCQVTTG